jgi:hypothetical protein
MSVTQKDFLLRQIEAFVESLRKLIELKSRGEPGEALEVVQETAEQIFGSSLPVIDSLDPESAADMLVEPEKVEMYARLAEEEAEILAMLGQKVGERRLRALEMYLERTRMSPAIDKEMKRRIGKLSKKVDRGQMGERYRALLEAVVR